MTDLTPTPPLDLAALTVIAKAVDPLEWTVAFGGVGTSVYSNWENQHGEYATRIADGLSSEEAAHIAAFDPPTVLAMIARLENAEALYQVRHGHVLAAEEDRNQWRARAEAAESKVKAVRAMIAEYGEQPHSDECGSGDCCRCTLDDMTRALDGGA